MTNTSKDADNSAISQFDMWKEHCDRIGDPCESKDIFDNATLQEIARQEHMFGENPWKHLRQTIAENGLRNAIITAHMPLPNPQFPNTEPPSLSLYHHN